RSRRRTFAFARLAEKLEQAPVPWEQRERSSWLLERPVPCVRKRARDGRSNAVAQRILCRAARSIRRGAKPPAPPASALAPRTPSPGFPPSEALASPSSERWRTCPARNKVQREKQTKAERKNVSLRNS